MRNTLGTMALALVAGSWLALAPLAGANTELVDFEAYALGCIHGQDGWYSPSSAPCQTPGLWNPGCAEEVGFDHEIVANGPGAPASFGAQSLRMSNAVTGGCFDSTFSKSLANEAGEDGAASAGMSGGVRQAVFDADWEFASTVPGAEQAGLSVVVSADRGDGARMTWVQMADTPDGLAVNFFDYKHGHASNACDGDNFRFTSVASGGDRAVPHSIGMLIVFADGADNDVVTVFVDGAPRHVGTTWEDFFRDCQPENCPDSCTVDSLLLRTGGGHAPGTLGNGFLIDNLRLSSSLPDLPPLL